MPDDCGKLEGVGEVVAETPVGCDCLLDHSFVGVRVLVGW